jgi:hypothetical protein
VARWTVLSIPSLGAWRATSQLLEKLGIDPNDPAITFRDYKFSPPSPYIVYRLLLPDEDFVAYTATLLLVGALAVARWRRPVSPRRGFSHRITSWLVVMVAMFLLHCIVLKWQFWGNRLLLPVALMACPFMIAWTGIWRAQRARKVVAVILLLQSTFVLGFSLNRPLITLPPAWRYAGAIPLFSASRTARFYSGYNAETVPVVQQLLAAVRDRHWRRVGLSLDENYPEYALWKALHDAGYDHVELYHINARPPRNHTLPWPPAVDGHISLPSRKEVSDVGR